MRKKFEILGVVICLLLSSFLLTGCYSTYDSDDESDAYEDEYDEEDEEEEEATYTPYDEAINCIDEEGPYGGRVVSWSSPDVNGDPLFINIGADYPDDSRLTVVIWGGDPRRIHQ